MSDLSDRIASEHQPVWSGIVDGRDVYICHCQDEDERTFAAHLAHIVERAVREQIASEIHKWGIVADECGWWSCADIWWDAEAIARGEG
ncbi:MAG: hypothetical protein GX875_10005 [Propionibacterium sp.]|nr:hypothetical protein [Propionibacterium sp.]